MSGYINDPDAELALWFFAQGQGGKRPSVEIDDDRLTVYLETGEQVWTDFDATDGPASYVYLKPADGSASGLISELENEVLEEAIETAIMSLRGFAYMAAANAVAALNVLPTPAERLEQLRQILRAENMSYGELAELQGMVEHIDPGDVELLEAAGVPEFGSFPDEVATAAEGAGVQACIVASAGADGATVVMIDTTFEPDGSDGGTGLRVLVNDAPVFEGVKYRPTIAEGIEVGMMVTIVALGAIGNRSVTGMVLRMNHANVLIDTVWWPFDELKSITPAIDFPADGSMETAP